MSEEQTTNQKSCKCKILIGLVILSLLMSIASLVFSSISYSTVLEATGGRKIKISKKYDRGKSFKKAQATGKPMVVFFYTDWCGYCQRFAPTFHKITKDKEFKKEFAVAYVNCEKPENSDIVREYNISGFPTVYVIDKNGNKHHLENDGFYDENSEKTIKENIFKLIK